MAYNSVLIQCYNSNSFSEGASCFLFVSKAWRIKGVAFEYLLCSKKMKQEVASENESEIKGNSEF